MDYSILDFGAKSGGDFLCTSAIQKTIDTCSENGGGRVVEINVNNGTIVKNCSVTNVRAMAGPKLYSTSPNAVSDILLENIVQETIPDHRKDGLDANDWDTEGRTPAFTCLKVLTA